MNFKCRKSISLILISFITIVLLSGCEVKADNNLSEEVTSDKKEITVGFISSGDSCCTTPVDKNQGFQTALWEEVGKYTEYKINFKSADKESIIDLYKSGKIDTIVYKFDKDEKSQLNYEFTVPIVDVPITTINQFPFKDDSRGKDLLKIVNESLKGMEEKGTIKQLKDKWFNESLDK